MQHPTALPSTFSSARASTSQLEQEVRSRIESMSYLPTTAAVAMKFMELGRDPEAQPDAYGKVISSDSSLSSKLLGLANSSWFGVRNRVTKIQVGINLLGLGTVRTLAVSYCLTGLHNELRLSPAESRMFWAGSLCKAVAAKQLAMQLDKSLAEEAFAAGLFQDFALPVMFAVSREHLSPLLHDCQIDWKTRLQKERALFRLDHAESARAIAQKLELPEMFVDAAAFHHNRPSLREMLGKPVLADAVYVASLFPHILEAWNPADAAELRQVLAEIGAGHSIDPDAFLQDVQRGFDDIYKYFERGETPDISLRELLEQATREAADSTTRLVGVMHGMLQQAASEGKEISAPKFQGPQAAK